MLGPLGQFSGHFMAIWYILCSFGTFFGFGIMHQVKSGNPGVTQRQASSVFGIN
jgi:hypothetical protein